MDLDREPPTTHRLSGWTQQGTLNAVTGRRGVPFVAAKEMRDRPDTFLVLEKKIACVIIQASVATRVEVLGQVNLLVPLLPVTVNS